MFFLIKIEIGSLFTITTDYFVGGLELKSKLIDEKNRDTNIQAIKDGLERLLISKNFEKLSVESFFSQENDLNEFIEYGKNLSEIQGLLEEIQKLHSMEDLQITYLPMENNVAVFNFKS